MPPLDDDSVIDSYRLFAYFASVTLSFSRTRCRGAPLMPVRPVLLCPKHGRTAGATHNHTSMSNAPDVGQFDAANLHSKFGVMRAMPATDWGL